MELFRFAGDRRRSFIYDLLLKWHKTLSILEKAMGVHDLPYVYRERPNLGILAAASAKAGYIPFEEYSTKKGRGKSRRPGRDDLWLVTKDESKTFNFEAKYIDVSFRSKQLARTMQRSLDIAVQDVSDLRYKSDRSVGILFVCPYGATHEGFDPEPFWNQLCDLKLFHGDFSAFHICSPEIWTKNSHEGRPGIAIIGRYLHTNVPRTSVTR